MVDYEISATPVQLKLCNRITKQTQQANEMENEMLCSSEYKKDVIFELQRNIRGRD